MLRVTNILKQSQEQMSNSRALSWLENIGIRAETVFRYGLGYLTESVKVEDKEVPRGILFPAYNKEGTLVSLRVLHSRSASVQEFYQVFGTPFPFGINHLRENVPLIVCKNEIDALLVVQEAGDFVDAIAWWENRFTPLQGIKNPQWFVVTDKSKSMQIHFWHDIPLCSLYFPNADIRAFVSRGQDLRSTILSWCVEEGDPILPDVIRKLGGICSSGNFTQQRMILLSGRYSPEKQQEMLRMWKALTSAEFVKRPKGRRTYSVSL